MNHEEIIKLLGILIGNTEAVGDSAVDRKPMNMNETDNGFFCPSCDMKLVGKTYSGCPCAKIDMPNDEPVKFCPRCGQAVKWE